MRRRTHSVFLVLGLAIALLGASRVAQPASAPLRIIQGISLEVPRKGVEQGTWDDALGGILGGGLLFPERLRSIYPDVRICLESPHVPGRCYPPCENAAPPAESAGYLCEISTGPNGILLESTLYLLADDLDDIGGNERIAMFKIDSPEKCGPCSLELPGGTLKVHLRLANVRSYAGPYRGTVGTFTPNLPLATPGTGTVASSAPGNLVDTLEQLLPGLRDADSCVGPDRGVFDQWTAIFRPGDVAMVQALGKQEADRYRHMATFANAFKDPGARTAVVQALRRRGVDLDDPLHVLAAGHLEHSQALDDLAHKGVQFVADMALQWSIAKGLGKVLPGIATSRNEFVREIELEMAAELAGSRADAFMDRVFKRPEMTAECALNELAKIGLGNLIENPPR